MQTEKLSTTFSIYETEISLRGSGMLRGPMARRPSKAEIAKEIPKEMGNFLESSRLRQGLTLKRVKEIAEEDFRFELGATTVRDTENSVSANPGIKTIEGIALALGEDPLSVIAMALDEPLENSPGFKRSQFASLYMKYSKIEDPHRKRLIDDFLSMLIQKINEL